MEMKKEKKNAKKKRAEMNMGRPGGQGLLIFGPWPHNRGRGGRTGERLENSRRGWGRKLKKEGKKKERQGGERKKEKKEKKKGVLGRGCSHLISKKKSIISL